MKTIILAGGEGRRLRPYTSILPKPLMPVDQKPILQHILEQLQKQGFEEIYLSVGYLASLLEAYFGDGERFGVKIRYLRETKPLGTAGPLSLVEANNEPILVMNGDILTNLDFKVFVDFHIRHHKSMTIATYKKQVDITLGVLELDQDSNITQYKEKPRLDYLVSMGVYCCDSDILSYIPKNQQFDLPELVKQLIKENILVKAYEHNGFWLDIGRPEDYDQAQDAINCISQDFI